jgi:hypothetical protein
LLLPQRAKLAARAAIVKRHALESRRVDVHRVRRVQAGVSNLVADPARELDRFAGTPLARLRRCDSRREPHLAQRSRKDSRYAVGTTVIVKRRDAARWPADQPGFAAHGCGRQPQVRAFDRTALCFLEHLEELVLADLPTTRRERLFERALADALRDSDRELSRDCGYVTVVHGTRYIKLRAAADRR